MKYRLIDKTTGIETLCDKVTIDGFDYYVSKEIIKDVRPHHGKWQVEEGTVLNKFPTYLTDLSSCRLVIATNNPNIDIPKVVDEVESFIKKTFYADDGINFKRSTVGADDIISSFKQGYNKSQETHPFSEEDLISFAHFYFKEEFNSTMQDCKSTEEILQLWKKQQFKTVYYE